MWNPMLLLAVAAFICALISFTGKIPVTVAVLLLCVYALLQSVPIGR